MSSVSKRIESQPVRLLYLALYVGLLLIVSWGASGTLLPPVDTKGLWFYAGLAALVLGELIGTPLFVRPADTIAYVISALSVLIGVNPANSQGSASDVFAWRLALALSVLLLCVAVGAVVLKDQKDGWRNKLGQALFSITSVFGTATLVFSGLFTVLLFLFHRHQARELLFLTVGWMVVVAFRPIERIGAVVSRIARVWGDDSISGDSVGVIVGHASPGMLLFRDDSSSLEPGDTVLARNDAGIPSVGIVLDRVGYVDGRWNRAILTGLLGPSESVALLSEDAVLDTVRRLPASAAARVPGLKEEVTRLREKIVGVVAPGTRSERLLVDVTNLKLALSEGQLLEVSISERPTLYQVIEGTAKEEILREKNTRGYAVAEARKIGTWNAEAGRFEKVNWLPSVNQTVELASYPPAQFTGRSVGHFPGTGYTVTIDVHQLVTHSATILGVLGSGKSFLGIEVVERILEAGCRVLCLDLTDQYAQELEPYYDKEAHRKVREHLRKIGEEGKLRVAKNVEEGGSINEFKGAVVKVAKKLIDPQGDKKLLVLDPSEFEVWRQDSRPFQNEASMATLTPAEITRIFADAVLEAAQELGMTKDARACLVLEEAHSLVPEWNAVASDGDRTATNGTARAILQGRKFGFGCLLVTQRTASVTKTILNQCNTVFALRAFDATGTDFLRNYFGDEYSSLLSSLEDRHAVVFGRASSCKAPVLIRLNDRDAFLAAFRRKGPAASDPSVDSTQEIEPEPAKQAVSDSSLVDDAGG